MDEILRFFTQTGDGVWAVDQEHRIVLWTPVAEELRLLPLLEDAHHLIVVDAVDVGAAPGTVVVVRPEDAEVAPSPGLSLHEMGPLEALALLEATTGRRPSTTIVGVQPADLAPWDDALSEPVARALPQAVQHVLKILEGLGVPIDARSGSGQTGPESRPARSS